MDERELVHLKFRDSEGDVPSHGLGAPLRLEMCRKNNRLLRARLEAGCRSAREAACQIGITETLLGRYEALKISPLNANTGEWRSTARRIAEFYGYSCEELWPKAVQKIKRTALAMELASAPSPGQSVEEIEEGLDRDRLRLQMGRALAYLTGHQQALLKARFGDDLSLAQAGKQIGGRSRDTVQRNRVYQLEIKALCQLRRSSLAKLLRPFIPGEVPDETEKQRVEVQRSAYLLEYEAAQAEQKVEQWKQMRAAAQARREAIAERAAGLGLRDGDFCWYWERYIEGWIRVRIWQLSAVKDTAQIHLEALDLLAADRQRRGYSGFSSLGYGLPERWAPFYQLRSDGPKPLEGKPVRPSRASSG